MKVGIDEKDDEKEDEILITQLNGSHTELRHSITNKYIVANKYWLAC